MFYKKYSEPLGRYPRYLNPNHTRRPGPPAAKAPHHAQHIAFNLILITHPQVD
ncbi:MAG: hypothetical protein ACI83D_000576 [Planctomycetota bacterium]|jgi:hypothetical protein